MKRFSFVACFVFLSIFSYGASINFPDVEIYSELGSDVNIVSSYKINLEFDTGLKYGLKFALGIKGYRVSTLVSNFINFDSFRIYSKPFDLFYLGYFLGRNTTLGKSFLGYSGFQFHQRPHFEYIGYKDINGTGIEWYMDLLDNLFQPHIFVYQPGDTNLVNVDALFYLNMENYKIEAYFGLNDISIASALANNTLAKRFGLFLSTVYGKVDFFVGLYSPDSLMTNIPGVDSLYLNVTEHIVFGYFEQTLALFTRPSSYNGYAENISNDVDIYFAGGAKIDALGVGLENSFLMSSNYPLTDRIGVYFYFTDNGLRYKFGLYYNAFGNAYASAYGGFISITGSL
jgi:hypothetical protein